MILDMLLNLGVKEGYDLHKIRLMRQINGLNLFYTAIAGSVSIIFIFIRSSPVLATVQVAATFLYMLNLILNSAGKLRLTSNLTIYLFETQMFVVMLYTNAWHSAALNLIILYPLLAALCEVSITLHMVNALGQAMALYLIHRFAPGVEQYFVSAGGVNEMAGEVLMVMAGTYTPVMAAVIIGIIYNENLRARRKQKEMLAEISDANRQLETYANQLKDETQRLKTEISIAKRIQTMVLPSEEEVAMVNDLDIACIMRTATEVGGDYYDVIKIGNKITIGMGDVTGHGLSSGLIMLMAQTAIRTLAEMKVVLPSEYLEVINRVLHANISRIKDNRSMTLIILNYENGKYTVSGQHESIAICRNNGEIDLIDTMDNGFYVGMTLEPAVKFNNTSLKMEKGDVMMLYSDGVTEAENEEKTQFGLENLCATLRKYHALTAEQIKNKFMKDLYNYMGESEIYDDISMVVIKQK